MIRSAVRSFAVAIGMVFLGTLPGAADPVADFYKGRELTILIGHPPGGSYDLYAQLTAAHIGKFIPGQPNVIVQQMPGGGGSKATAHFYNRAPHDGSIIALFPETIAYVQLMDPSSPNGGSRKRLLPALFRPLARPVPHRHDD